MKRVKLIVLLLLICLSTVFAQIRFDVKAGVNFSNINFRFSERYKPDTESVTGIYLGLGAEIPIRNNFFIHPALIYAQRGFKENTDGFYTVKNRDEFGLTADLNSLPQIGRGKNFRTRLSYLEVPVDIKYKIGLGNGNIFLTTGPYIAWGLAGSWKDDARIDLNGKAWDGRKGAVKFGSDGWEMNNFSFGKRFDYGARFGLGYALFSRYSLALNMQRGLKNLTYKDVTNAVVQENKNRSIDMTLGYTF